MQLTCTNLFGCEKCNYALNAIRPFTKAGQRWPMIVVDAIMVTRNWLFNCLLLSVACRRRSWIIMEIVKPSQLNAFHSADSENMNTDALFKYTLYIQNGITHFKATSTSTSTQLFLNEHPLEIVCFCSLVRKLKLFGFSHFPVKIFLLLVETTHKKCFNRFLHMQEGAMNWELDTGTRITRERCDCDKTGSVKGTQKRNEKIASSNCLW